MLEHWAGKYSGTKGLWINAWEWSIPFLNYDVEICRVICSTNAIESLNLRFHRSIRACGHFLKRRPRSNAST
jgi:putative transposase